MKLTKAIKRQLALDIVAAAAKKHAPALIKTAEKLRNQWREAYKAHFRFVAPGLEEKEWAKLIQLGVLSSVSRHGGLELRNYDPLDSSPYRTTDKALDFDVYVGKRPKYHLIDLVAAVKQGFSGLSILSAHGRDGSMCIGFKSTEGNHDIPGASCVSVVDYRYLNALKGDDKFYHDPAEEAWFKLAGPLVKPTSDLLALYMKVFTEADKHFIELSQALAAVSTRAQLIELFPEAEQFLPEPPPKPSKIVPANLFSNARKMLEEGIPT